MLCHSLNLFSNIKSASVALRESLSITNYPLMPKTSSYSLFNGRRARDLITKLRH